MMFGRELAQLLPDGFYFIRDSFHEALQPLAFMLCSTAQ